MASGLDARCVKKQCGLVGLSFGGRMALDLRLSRARKEVVAMRQNSNYEQLDTMKLGRFIYIFFYKKTQTLLDYPRCQDQWRNIFPVADCTW